MCVVGEGCARGRGDVGEAPRSLCWGESVTTKKIYFPWNYHRMATLVFCIFTYHFTVQHYRLFLKILGKYLSSGMRPR